MQPFELLKSRRLTHHFLRSLSKLHFLYNKFVQAYFKSSPFTKMPSCEFYMAMKVVNLRHELTARGLPTAGLKQDLAFRLAGSDDANGFCPLMPPHAVSALRSPTSHKETTLGKMEGYSKPTTGVKDRIPTGSSPSEIDPSLPSVPDPYEREKGRRIRSLATVSAACASAFLPVLLILFLSSILWRSLPNLDKEDITMRIHNGHDLVSSTINDFKDLVSSKSHNNNPSMCTEIQTLGDLHESGKRRSASPPLCCGISND